MKIYLFCKPIIDYCVLYNQEKSAFIKQFENVHECICQTQNGWEEIINRGWIAKISQLRSPATTTNNNFCKDVVGAKNICTVKFLIKDTHNGNLLRLGLYLRSFSSHLEFTI